MSVFRRVLCIYLLFQLDSHWCEFIYLSLSLSLSFHDRYIKSHTKIVNNNNQKKILKRDERESWSYTFLFFFFFFHTTCPCHTRIRLSRIGLPCVFLLFFSLFYTFLNGTRYLNSSSRERERETFDTLFFVCLCTEAEIIKRFPSLIFTTKGRACRVKKGGGNRRWDRGITQHIAASSPTNKRNGKKERLSGYHKGFFFLLLLSLSVFVFNCLFIRCKRVARSLIDIIYLFIYFNA